MRQHIVGILVGVAVIIGSGTTRAESVDLVLYDFTGTDLAASSTDSSVSSTDIGASVTVAVNSGAAQIYDAAVTKGGYLEFTLSPQSGYTLYLESLSFSAQRSISKGTLTIDVVYSLDSTATFSPIGINYDLSAITSFTTYNIDLSALDSISSTGITFRLNLDSSSGGNGRFTSIDSIAVSGVAVQLPPATWLMGSGLLALVGIARRKSR